MVYDAVHCIGKRMPMSFSVIDANRIASHGLNILAHLERPITTTAKLKNPNGRSQKNGLKGKLFYCSVWHCA
jgi:hypothetical protein